MKRISVILLLVLIQTIGAVDEAILNQITFYKSKETLDTIVRIIAKKQKGVYLRFGDGDVSLARGRPDSLQKQTAQLSQEMQEAFRLTGPTVLKCLVLNCPGVGFEPGMLPGKFACNRSQAAALLHEALAVTRDITEVYSPTALHFTATDNQDYAIRFLRFIRSCKNIVFVGNQNVPDHIRTLLFGSSCAFVPTPVRDAYSEIDRIEQDCVAKISSIDGYTVVVLAMGCSGRALQKRLWHQCDNIFLFDFGSLMDALCGWDTRAWISLSNFDKDNFLAKLSRDIKVVCTAALIDEQWESRKQEYIAACTTLHTYAMMPHIIESISTTKTFFDDYSQYVYYTKTNDARTKNKGVNEVAAMKKVLADPHFHDEDMIIKLTGRYYCTNDSFIRLVEANPQLDAVIKRNENNVVFTGCYAMRCKYLRKFLGEIDLDTMRHQMIGIETLMTNYIAKMSKEGMQIRQISDIHLVANIFGEGIPQMTYW